MTRSSSFRGAIATYDLKLLPQGYQQITSLSSARSLTPPANCVGALIQAEDQDVRWRANGTDPTASVGMLLQKGTEFWCIADLSTVRFIETAASAKLNVHYFTAPDEPN